MFNKHYVMDRELDGVKVYQRLNHSVVPIVHPYNLSGTFATIEDAEGHIKADIESLAHHLRDNDLNPNDEPVIPVIDYR